MSKKLNQMLDFISNYIAHRKGLLPLIGILMITANFIIQFFQLGWFSESNFLLHLGIILTIFGFMLAWAL